MAFEYKHTSSINIIETSLTENYIALGDKTGLTVQKFQISKSNDGKFTFSTKDVKNSKYIHIPTNGSRVTSICFDNSEDLKFAFTTSDKMLQVNHQDKVLMKENRHNGYINSTAFLGKTHIVTASDDHTAKVTSFDLSLHDSFDIRKYSNIVKVSTHKDEDSQFILSEEAGINAIHDIRIGTAKETSKFYTETKNVKPKQPLYDSHWHPNDPNLFASVADYEYFVWDLRSTKSVLFKDISHHTGATNIRWSQHGTSTLATSTANDFVTIHTLMESSLNDSTNINEKVVNRTHTHQQKYRVGGMAWTNTEPDFCVTGCDTTLQFWKSTW